MVVSHPAFSKVRSKQYGSNAAKIGLADRKYVDGRDGALNGVDVAVTAARIRH